MRRAEIWWARLPPPIGNRPVLLLSRDDVYASRRSVTVAPVTTRVRGLRVEVLLGTAEGLSRPSVANLDNIQTVSKRYLSSRVSTLPPERMREVEGAIKFALSIP